MSDTPEINITMESIPVTAKPRKLKATWTIEPSLHFSVLISPKKKEKKIEDPIEALMKKIGYEIKGDEVDEIEGDEVDIHCIGAYVCQCMIQKKIKIIG